MGGPAVAMTPEEALNDATEVEFIETPLVDACKFLTDLHNTKIVLDKGVPRDIPINLVNSGVRVRDVLNEMLRPHKLDYSVMGDSIVIHRVKPKRK